MTRSDISKHNKLAIKATIRLMAACECAKSGMSWEPSNIAEQATQKNIFVLLFLLIKTYVPMNIILFDHS